MTLATVPRYDPDATFESGDHAVVVGASVAGLLAARVLSDGFEEVTVLDRDSLPAEPTTRDGTPQARQPHVLLEAGRATLEDLFPGFGEDLISAGGLLVDGASDFEYFDAGDFAADGPTRELMVFASRPLIEHVLRRRVTDIEGVFVRSNHQIVDYRFGEDANAIDGAVVRDEDGTRREVPADLIVDATGRTSRTPKWLEDNGFAAPNLDEVTIDLVYCSTIVERPRHSRRTLYVPLSPPRTRGGAAFPIEGNRWLVNLHGIHGDHPPTDPEGFSQFAASLPTPAVARLIDEQPRVGDDVVMYPIPSNRRYRYETLDRFPEGLLVVGDAIASFNPVYAQGMSVAALEAVVLHHAMAEGGKTDLASRFFTDASAVVDVAWNMATGADLRFEETTGPEPRGIGFFNWYLARLARKAHTDGQLRHAMYQTIVMERPPTSLFRPSVAWRVLKPSL